MKLAIIITLSLWLLSGAVGAYMMDHLDAAHWKTIARGPITLAAAMDEHPIEIL